MSPVSADSPIEVARTIEALRARVDAWRSDGRTVGLVPTMGALHEGHLSLVRKSVETADRTVASIFVNPAQFAPHEDLATYPRNEADDLEKLAAAGCHLAFAPDADEMYPDGFQTRITVESIAKGLCGDSRPHFFGGVATVVCKLLNQCRPDIAVFGEKDFQQLLVIRRMVRDLDIPVEIIGGPIVREPDGLAMSSRNAYLSPNERSIAAELNRTLADMTSRLETGEAISAVMEDGRNRLIAAGFDRVDYLEARIEDGLAPIVDRSAPAGVSARLFAAVILGKTRLIDNWPIRRAS